MCVIIIANSYFPSRDLLRSAEESNPHGLGMAWYKRDKNGNPVAVSWAKGIDIETAIKISKKHKPPYMLHFRLATVGGPVPELTHPFPVTNDCSLALNGSAQELIAHNGHWSDWHQTLCRLYQLIPDFTHWSDSRAIAWAASYAKDYKTKVDFFKDVYSSRIAYMHLGGIDRLGHGWIDRKDLDMHFSSFISGYIYRGNYSYKGSYGAGYCASQVTNLSNSTWIDDEDDDHVIKITDLSKDKAPAEAKEEKNTDEVLLSWFQKVKKQRRMFLPCTDTEGENERFLGLIKELSIKDVESLTDPQKETLLEMVSSRTYSIHQSEDKDTLFEPEGV